MSHIDGGSTMSNIVWGVVTVLVLGVLSAGCVSVPADGASAISDADPDAAAQINLQLAEQYIAQGNHARAGQRLLKAVSLAPSSGQASLALADWYAQNNYRDAAERWYLRSLELLGDDGVVHNRLGVLYCQQQQLAKANEQFFAAIGATLNPQPLAAYTNQAYCYYELAQYPVVEAQLQKVLAIEANHAPAVLLMAKTKSVTQQHAEALNYLRRYESLVPLANMSPATFVIVKRIAELSGDWALYTRYQRWQDAQPSRQTQ